MDETGALDAGAPSRTAMLTATIRGWHLLVHGRDAVLGDWFGWPFVGDEAENILAGWLSIFGDSADEFTTWVAARSRIAEDWLAASAAKQYVSLGAGLDSFAWRQRSDIRVFEVDHPATQAWKRSRVAALALPVPSSLAWVPVDFESQSLTSGLARAGLGPASTFFSWLGVVPYLSVDALAATLRDLPPCSLAVSYVTPPDTWEGESRRIGERLQVVVREHGEPWLSFFSPGGFAEVLDNNGFAVIDDVGPEHVEARYGLPAINYERIALARKSATG